VKIFTIFPEGIDLLRAALFESNAAKRKQLKVTTRWPQIFNLFQIIHQLVGLKLNHLS